MSGEPGLVLPYVRAWRQPPPPVTFPVFELAGWVGPRWMLGYDDGSTGNSLGSVRLAFGPMDEDGPRTYTDVTTVVKRRAADPNLRDEPTSLNGVCEQALFVLLEREAAYAPADQRLALSRKLLAALPAVDDAPEGYLPEAFQPSAELTVDGQEVVVFATAGAKGWALCADLGDVFVAVIGDGTRGGPVELTHVTDLGPYSVEATDYSK